MKSILKKLGFNKDDGRNSFKIDPNNTEVFKYQFIPTNNSENEDFMIEFNATKNAKSLVGEILILLDKLGFENTNALDLWMNDEVLINSISENGQVTVSLDIWDFVFILSDNNQVDLRLIESTLNDSKAFERIEKD